MLPGLAMELEPIRQAEGLSPHALVGHQQAVGLFGLRVLLDAEQADRGQRAPVVGVFAAGGVLPDPLARGGVQRRNERSVVGKRARAEIRHGLSAVGRRIRMDQHVRPYGEGGDDLAVADGMPSVRGRMLPDDLAGFHVQAVDPAVVAAEVHLALPDRGRFAHGPAGGELPAQLAGGRVQAQYAVVARRDVQDRIRSRAQRRRQRHAVAWVKRDDLVGQFSRGENPSKRHGGCLGLRCGSLFLRFRCGRCDGREDQYHDQPSHCSSRMEFAVRHCTTPIVWVAAQRRTGPAAQSRFCAPASRPAA